MLPPKQWAQFHKQALNTQQKQQATKGGNKVRRTTSSSKPSPSSARTLKPLAKVRRTTSGKPSLSTRPKGSKQYTGGPAQMKPKPQMA